MLLEKCRFNYLFPTRLAPWNVIALATCAQEFAQHFLMRSISTYVCLLTSVEKRPWTTRRGKCLRSHTATVTATHVA